MFHSYLKMMLVALFLAVAAAAPQADVVIVKQTQEHDTETGKYSFRLVSYLINALHLCRMRNGLKLTINDGIGPGFFTAGKPTMVSRWKRAESRKSSEMRPVPFPRDLTPSPLMAPPSLSNGLLMRTDSKPREIICQLPHLCPNTLSSCSATWAFNLNDST